MVVAFACQYPSAPLLPERTAGRHFPASLQVGGAAACVLASGMWVDLVGVVLPLSPPLRVEQAPRQKEPRGSLQRDRW